MQAIWHSYIYCTTPLRVRYMCKQHTGLVPWCCTWSCGESLLYVNYLHNMFKPEGLAPWIAPGETRGKGASKITTPNRVAQQQKLMYATITQSKHGHCVPTIQIPCALSATLMALVVKETYHHYLKQNTMCIEIL